ncbi:MAG TPA: sensor histidine kinase [Actinocatenispora sp.]
MRDGYYAVVLAGTLVAVWYTGVGAGRTVALVALGALAVWYCLVGRRATRDVPIPTRTLCYQVGVACLLVTAELATSSSALVLFALIPQCFMLLPLVWALVATVLFNVVPVATTMAEASGYAATAIAGIVVALVVFAMQFGWWIDRIIRQSQERADLIGQLAAARTELAETERQAGMLAERQRLAMEIHDTLAQGFTSILMLLEAAESAPPEQAAAHRSRAARAARENLAEARALVASQPPTGLADMSLHDALRRLVTRLGEDTGIDTDWDLAGEPRRLPAGTEVVVLRCAQEALTNVRRHAGAARASLRLRYTADTVGFDVSDDGAGFDPGSSAGFGLSGMRERIAQVGGRLDIDSTPGAGTRLTVEVPA